MVHGYVHTNKVGTSIENQRFIIKEFAAQNNLEIENWIEDDGLRYSEDYNPQDFEKLLKDAKEGDTIIFYNIVFIGDEMYIILDFITQCMRKKIKVWNILNNKILGDNESFDLTGDTLKIFADIEREPDD